MTDERILTLEEQYIEELQGAERKFLMDFGWKREVNKTFKKRLVEYWKDPKNGDLMQRWTALARQKVRCGYESHKPV
jgi:hypothetical protein